MREKRAEASTTRESADSLGETAGNFARAVPFAIAVSLMTIRDVHVRPTGLLLAIASRARHSSLAIMIGTGARMIDDAVAAAALQDRAPDFSAYH